MADQLQLRGGTTSESLGFTGAQREVVVDTDKHTLRIHDGITAGGYALATSSDLSDGTIYYNDNVSGGSAADAYILAAKANTNIPTAYKDGIRLGFVTNNSNTGPSTANFQGLGVKSIKLNGGADPAAGAISGRVDLVYDASNDWLELQQKATARNLQLRPITAVVSGNTLTFTLQPTAIDFRSLTLNSGVPISRTITANLTIVVPNGATLGTTSGAPSRIAVLAVPSGSGTTLAVVNMAGAVVLDETGLINTVAISAASNSASVVYSTSSQSSVPYRVLGYAESTQATAGTWTSAPNIVQPQGGQALMNYNILKLFSQQSATSGGALDFTGIPVNARRVTIMFNGVSTSGTSSLLVQIGAAGSIQTSGYSSVGATVAATSAGATSYTTGFGIRIQSAGDITFGSMTLTLMDQGTGAWASHGGFCTITPTLYANYSAGGKTLSGVLDRIRITTVNGTDGFDLGAINIMVE